MKEAAGLLSRIWRVDRILSGFNRETIVSEKPITSYSHHEILYRGTLSMCFTLGEITEDRKRRVRETGCSRYERKRESKKEAEKNNKRALRAITGSYSGEKKQKQ